MAIGITQKLSKTQRAGWQKQLGEFMESPKVSGVVIALILVDLAGTFVNDMCENTDLINPAYDEQKESMAQISHIACVTVLCIFFLEQLLHLVAFGAAFFTKFWFVMDLVVVTVSLVCETVLEDTAKDWLGLFITLRLWKVVAFVFDMCLGDTEASERDEKVFRPDRKDPKHTGITGKLSNRPEAADDHAAAIARGGGFRKGLGEFMESPKVSAVIIALIFVDLSGTFVNDICENTDWVNPAYDEQKERVARMTHTACVTVLVIFLVEQLLHLVAFGRKFFTKFWFVMDLVVVSASLVCETVLEDTAKGWLGLFIVLRLWKLVAFIFDMLLAQQESAERDEAVYKQLSG